MRNYVVAVFVSIMASAPALADDNCYKTCPNGAKNGNTVITREFYTLSNNPTTKFADWVAYKVTKRTIGKTQKRLWKQDPDLPPDDTLHPNDYKDAPGALKIDRGHQAPLASFTGQPGWAVMNYLSNITPQSTLINQGPWEELESAERALARMTGVNAVYVVTGTLYEKSMKPLPKSAREHVVPSGYWKVVAVENGGNFKTAAFIMHQDSTATDYCNYLVTISDIEERSNLELFPGLSSAKRKVLAENAGELVDGIGCEFIETSVSKKVKNKTKKS